LDESYAIQTKKPLPLNGWCCTNDAHNALAMQTSNDKHYKRVVEIV